MTINTMVALEPHPSRGRHTDVGSDAELLFRMQS